MPCGLYEIHAEHSGRVETLDVAREIQVNPLVKSCCRRHVSQGGIALFDEDQTSAVYRGVSSVASNVRSDNIRGVSRMERREHDASGTANDKLQRSLPCISAADHPSGAVEAGRRVLIAPG